MIKLKFGKTSSIIFLYKCTQPINLIFCFVGSRLCRQRQAPPEVHVWRMDDRWRTAQLHRDLWWPEKSWWRHLARGVHELLRGSQRHRRRRRVLRSDDEVLLGFTTSRPRRQAQMIVTWISTAGICSNLTLGAPHFTDLCKHSVHYHTQVHSLVVNKHADSLQRYI